MVWLTSSQMSLRLSSTSSTRTSLHYQRLKDDFYFYSEVNNDDDDEVLFLSIIQFQKWWQLVLFAFYRTWPSFLDFTFLKLSNDGGFVRWHDNKKKMFLKVEPVQFFAEPRQSGSSVPWPCRLLHPGRTQLGKEADEVWLIYVNIAIIIISIYMWCWSSPDMCCSPMFSACAGSAKLWWGSVDNHHFLNHACVQSHHHHHGTVILTVALMSSYYDDYCDDVIIL